MNIERRIAKLPFVGNYIIENNAKKAIYSGTKSKLEKTATATLVLGSFAAAHFYQSKLGLTEIIGDSKDFQSRPNLIDGAEISYTSLFTAASIAAGYAQVSLARRVVHHYSKFRHETQARARARQDRHFKLRTYTMAEVAFTGGAQALFIALQNHTLY